MKYHPILKGLAIFLAAAALLTCIAGAAAAIVLVEMGLDAGSFEAWQYRQLRSESTTIAHRVFDRYQARELGHCSENALTYLGLNFTDSEITSFGADKWGYEIRDGYGTIVDKRAASFSSQPYTFSYEMSGQYPEDVTGLNLKYYDDSDSDWRDYFIQDGVEHYLYYYQGAPHTVTLSIDRSVQPSQGPLTAEQYELVFQNRYWVVWVLIAGLAIFVLCLVYLCFAAGRSADGKTLRASGLNRLPLDLYFLLAGAACAGCGAVGAIFLYEVIEDFQNASIFQLPIAAIALLAACLIALCFLYACIAQGKMGRGFWWKHSLVGRVIWFLLRGTRKLFRLLPYAGQWLLTAFLMVVVPVLLIIFSVNSYSFEGLWALLAVVAILADIAIVCYGAWAYGSLLKGAKTMAQGDLNQKLALKYMALSFQDFGEHLNALAGAASIAAQKQMQSERMKTELITNVSHDIKTPLTSIINFVDLLQKPHTPEEGTQYLEVLDRQSQRLKKLIDDLMEMSKASTGNMPVHTEVLDLAETVNQALGEFADKLSAADLQVVFSDQAASVKIYADGRLTWRVLSNLLSNTVKYALPGTRVYFDIARYNGNALLSIKNISRESLNIDAQELTERFVRGDTARNTEGSGLGLNIAKSLMELQKGQLNLLVDGDLFKVTLTFPEVQ